MEKAFSQPDIRFILSRMTPCIPEVDDVLYLLGLIKSPAKYHRYVPRYENYARNTALVAASVAVELLHCTGCHQDLAAARLTIQQAIRALTPDVVMHLPNASQVTDLCCTDH